MILMDDERESIVEHKARVGDPILFAIERRARRRAGARRSCGTRRLRLRGERGRGSEKNRQRESADRHACLRNEPPGGEVMPRQQPQNAGVAVRGLAREGCQSTLYAASP